MNNITGNGNNRCGSPHIAYQQLSCPVSGTSISVTGNMYPVTGITISVTGNKHITCIRYHGTIIQVIGMGIHVTRIEKPYMHV